MRRAAASLALAAAGVAGAAGAVVLSDQARRDQVERQLRVWRLTARRGIHWGAVRVRGRFASEEERAALEERFAIRSAEDVAQVLGGMKGAIMKAGQMLSFIADGLPPDAQAALATLQADVPPMAPSLAERVLREELGAGPERLFLDWDPEPVAAASIGQVHRAVMPDGRLVAVKVQYPGVDRAIKGDLDNAELMYGLFASFALKNLDVKALVDELRARMADELDYRIEAAHQAEFAARYHGHPFVHVPAVVPERSARRVLTSEWVGGQRWDEFLAEADEKKRQRAAEILFRFSQGSINRHRVFNGDPHPGNYRFQPDGTVTFLDFGLVKRWAPGEFEQLTPILDAILAGDAELTVKRAIDGGFLPADHGFDPAFVFEYVSLPYVPYLEETFAFTRSWVADTLARVIDIAGTYGELIRKLNMPPSYVILDRVVWGTSAMLGRLGARNTWRSLLDEYRHGAAPHTELGEEEAAWERARH
ncbi:MAG TPA: AarF/ABC1/UbiB kinase family protein [Acidimicrobiales bacterium]|nr:AarF/ABC1/UbiB kinase family protein [Acidimicrobiales bacterium]